MRRIAKLELRHLNKTYGPNNIPVQDLSLAVAEGEFLTLLGPSGCGKSTTLRLIAGLESPTEGQILIGGQVVNDQRPGDRNVAMVFQSYALYPHMTAYDNMASGLKLRRVPPAEIKTRVAEAARILGLEHLLQRKPGQLSGGQQQRVALGRALVRQPDVFLLDEPLSNLDALLREQVRSELKQIFATQRAPVVYVTHDQTEAMTLSSRVAVLYQGELQQLATPQQLYAQPANQFVAGFLGSPRMNLFSLPREGQVAHLAQTRLPVAEEGSDQSQVVLGIRPEHVLVRQPDAESKTIGHLHQVEHLGMHNLLTLQIEAMDITVRSLLPTDQTWNDDRLALEFPPQHCHWFDAQTGERLTSKSVPQNSMG